MVVKRQPVNYLIHRLPAGCKPLPVQPADLQATPQALRWGVVPAVALAAHRTLHLVTGQRALKFMSAVLTATVGMEDKARCWVPSKPRHLQGVRDQAALHVRLHAPAHHLAAEQVNHCCQVQPALVGGDVGDVACPDLIGRSRGEVALHQVWGNGQMVFAVGGDDKLAFASGADAV